MTLTEILENLDGVKQVAPGKYVALCPVHDDHHPSLSVCEGDKVAVVMRCFTCRGNFHDMMRVVKARAAGIR